MIKIEAKQKGMAKVFIGGSEDDLRLEIRTLIIAMTESPLLELFGEELDKIEKERK